MRTTHRLATLGVLTAVASATVAGQRRGRTAGSTCGERNAALPGDDRVDGSTVPASAAEQQAVETADEAHLLH